MFYYKIKIENGTFIGVDYNDILEGVATTKHVLQGCGFINTNKEYPLLEQITEEEFNTERVL